jgi:hypothetical protein
MNKQGFLALRPGRDKVLSFSHALATQPKQKNIFLI